MGGSTEGLGQDVAAGQETAALCHAIRSVRRPAGMRAPRLRWGGRCPRSRRKSWAGGSRGEKTPGVSDLQPEIVTSSLVHRCLLSCDMRKALGTWGSGE